jgi:nucleoside-diphosphate-sugar epimerase
MLLILGLGYSARWIAAEARALGLAVVGVRRQPGPDVMAFDDPALADAIARARFILSSVPPDRETGGDPVLERHGKSLAGAPGRLFYLSSTGVYGDTAGAWVDEAAPVGAGRRTARTAADLAWGALGATRLRLPGIYGPGRSAIDQVRAGTARRIDRPGHRFSRIHVADIAGATLAAMTRRVTGVVNIVDSLPAEPRAVTEAACRLLGAPFPPLEPLDMAALSPMARGFWTERRLVASARLSRDLGYALRYPDYRDGLAAIARNRGESSA